MQVNALEVGFLNCAYFPQKEKEFLAVRCVNLFEKIINSQDLEEKERKRLNLRVIEVHKGFIESYMKTEELFLKNLAFLEHSLTEYIEIPKEEMKLLCKACEQAADFCRLNDLSEDMRGRVNLCIEKITGKIFSELSNLRELVLNKDCTKEELNNLNKFVEEIEESSEFLLDNGIDSYISIVKSNIKYAAHLNNLRRIELMFSQGKKIDLAKIGNRHIYFSFVRRLFSENQEFLSEKKKTENLDLIKSVESLFESFNDPVSPISVADKNT